MRLSLWALALSSNLFFAATAAAQDRLVFVVDVIRHGDRTPLIDLPAVHHVWPQGLGQLTPAGMRQEAELGARLRSVYVDQQGLLPPSYTPGTMSVRSTDMDRTLMSAESFLMGLYPAQPVPIHTLPISGDTLLNPEAAGNKLDEALAREQSWKDLSSRLQPRFASWSRATGMAITTVDQLIFLRDTLMIDQRYHVPLPQALSEEDIQMILDEGSRIFLEKFSLTAPSTGRELLQTIAKDMQQAGQEKSPLRYVLFFAHDTTLISQMSVLQAPLSSTPPYASRLNFALLDTGRKGFAIKVFYNDQPVKIPACGGTSCSLAQFAALAGQ